LALLFWWQEGHLSATNLYYISFIGSVIHQVQKETEEVTGQPRLTWKMIVKAEVVVVMFRSLESSEKLNYVGIKVLLSYWYLVTQLRKISYLNVSVADLRPSPGLPVSDYHISK